MLVKGATALYYVEDNFGASANENYLIGIYVNKISVSSKLHLWLFLKIDPLYTPSRRKPLAWTYESGNDNSIIPWI